MADLFVMLVALLVFLYVGSFVNAFRQRRAEAAFRRRTLRFDEATGLYHWQTIDGNKHSADTHPDQPGGVWYEAELEGVGRMRC